MKTDILGVAYRHMLKPVLFKFPADTVHERALRLGKRLGEHKLTRNITRSIFSYENSSLNQKILNIEFKNPIGLAAGFDYNADLVEILPSIGFGFHTVGTVTNKAYEGNKAPMLGRLPKSKSLLVNKGFKNDGIGEILKGLPSNQTSVPYGISIGSTNRKYDSYIELVYDIVSAFKKAETNHTASYYELNISCPNLHNIKNLDDKVDTPHGFDILLEALGTLGIMRPIFVKMPVEKGIQEIDKLIEVAKQHLFISGFIFANLVKDRSNPKLDRKELEKVGAGNFSGKPTFELSNKLIEHVYRQYGTDFVIIGCGGVFTAEDAYKKIRLGASLVQLVTGLVYMGPAQIGKINNGLADLLKRDGFEHISEVIGIDAR